MAESTQTPVDMAAWANSSSNSLVSVLLRQAESEIKILYDTEEYFGIRDLPEPLWCIVIEDQRADPENAWFDPAVKLYRYPVLVNPVSGEFILIREPEDFANG